MSNPGDSATQKPNQDAIDSPDEDIYGIEKGDLSAWEYFIQAYDHGNALDGADTDVTATDTTRRRRRPKDTIHSTKRPKDHQVYPTMNSSSSFVINPAIIMDASPPMINKHKSRSYPMQVNQQVPTSDKIQEPPSMLQLLPQVSESTHESALRLRYSPIPLDTNATTPVSRATLSKHGVSSCDNDGVSSCANDDESKAPKVNSSDVPIPMFANELVPPYQQQNNAQLLLKPLTPYNYFYRDERDNIVSHIKSEKDPFPPQVLDFSSSKMQALLCHHWMVDPIKQKRIHRKSHGKVGFESLSKEIAKRWHKLPREGRAFYRNVALTDNAYYHHHLQRIHKQQLQQSESNTATLDQNFRGEKDTDEV